jgi:hypothetical protein
MEVVKEMGSRHESMLRKSNCCSSGSSAERETHALLGFERVPSVKGDEPSLVKPLPMAHCAISGHYRISSEVDVPPTVAIDPLQLAASGRRRHRAVNAAPIEWRCV